MNIVQPTVAEIAEAADAVQRYKEVLKKGKSYDQVEDEAMLAMYRQIAAGRQVINVFDAIKEGGIDDLHRPRLFFARANWKRVTWEPSTRGGGIFRDFARERWDRGSRHILDLPDNVLPNRPLHLRGDHYWSVVPSIPPQLRPRGRIDGYIILSEANWQAVPEDPALLRPIKWPLCAVVAVWDLTEIERKVLGITRIEG